MGGLICNISASVGKKVLVKIALFDRHTVEE